MTLPTPIINKVDVFDANNNFTFTFTYFGSQAVRNQLVIRDNITNDTVYDKTINSMRLSHEIKPEESNLVNGKTYNVQVKVFDANNEESNFSEKKIFTCYSKPTFSFSNIEDGKTVSMLNLTCYLSFLQNEGDKLKSFKYYLYDENMSELLSSDVFYSNDNMVYTYYDLKDLTSYYIRSVGETLYGFNVDTGFIKIFTQDTMLPNNVIFDVQSRNGKMYLNTNIISLDYDLENDNYILSDGLLTLIDNSITYKIDNINDFSLIVKAKNIPLNKVFLKLTSFDENKFVELSMVVINNDVYCKLLSAIYNQKYVIYKKVSTYEEYNNLGGYTIELHRKDCLYSLLVYTE